MPLTATLEDIKAYEEKVEKDQIAPHTLPPCSRCSVDSTFFKLHAYRERRFLVIIEMVIEPVFSTLVRFKCTGCGKTFTNYPDFAIPYKHFTRQSITEFAATYVESDDKTYQQALMVENTVPGYAESEKLLKSTQIHPDSGKTLAPSTVYRWITTLGGFVDTARKALNLILQENPASSLCRDLTLLNIPGRKYRSHSRKESLLSCRRLLLIETCFQAAFKVSIFTKLAINCAFG